MAFCGDAVLEIGGGNACGRGGDFMGELSVDGKSYAEVLFEDVVLDR